MSTIVCLHAHPDDEASSTGGTIARAVAEGHRVVLVVATNGDHGEVPDDLAPGETLVDRRRAEVLASAEVLGIERVEWLGYTDSGMTGWEQNAEPSSFHQADVDEAARPTGHHPRGRVGRRADRLRLARHVRPSRPRPGAPCRRPRRRDVAGTPRAAVHVQPDGVRRNAWPRRSKPANSWWRPEEDWDPDGPADDGNPFGSPEDEITLEVDVADFTDLKREALRCHRSQVTDTSFFLDMPAERFRQAFGTEWFIEAGVDAPMRRGWLFDIPD